MNRHYASVGLDLGLRACVLPTGKSPPLTPLEKNCTKRSLKRPELGDSNLFVVAIAVVSSVSLLSGSLFPILGGGLGFGLRQLG